MANINCQSSSSVLIRNKKCFLHDIIWFFYYDRTSQEESALGGAGGGEVGGRGDKSIPPFHFQ